MLCAAFYIIVSTDCDNFTFLDEINDVWREDEKNQSPVEVTGNLVGELPALTLGDVILTTMSLLNILFSATYKRSGVVSQAICEAKVSQKIIDSIT